MQAATLKIIIDMSIHNVVCVHIHITQILTIVNTVIIWQQSVMINALEISHVARGLCIIKK